MPPCGRSTSPRRERRIKMGMILAKIADREGIRVEDAEVDERLKRIAEETKRAYDYIREFYEKYDLKANLKEKHTSTKKQSAFSWRRQR